MARCPKCGSAAVTAGSTCTAIGGQVGSVAVGAAILALTGVGILLIPALIAGGVAGAIAGHKIDEQNPAYSCDDCGCTWRD